MSGNLNPSLQNTSRMFFNHYTSLALKYSMHKPLNVILAKNITTPDDCLFGIGLSDPSNVWDTQVLTCSYNVTKVVITINATDSLLYLQRHVGHADNRSRNCGWRKWVSGSTSLQCRWSADGLARWTHCQQAGNSWSTSLWETVVHSSSRAKPFCTFKIISFAPPRYW